MWGWDVAGPDFTLGNQGELKTLLSCPFPCQVGGWWDSGPASPPGEDPETGFLSLLPQKEGGTQKALPQHCQHGRCQAGQSGRSDLSPTSSLQRGSLMEKGPWTEGCIMRSAKGRTCKP